MNIPNVNATASTLQRVTQPAPASGFRSVSSPQSTPDMQQSTAANQGASESTKDNVREAAKLVEKFVALSNSEISFSVDDETGLSVVKVIDKGTDTVIRQMPSEEVIAIARTLDKLQGLLFTGKA